VSVGRSEEAVVGGEMSKFEGYLSIVLLETLGNKVRGLQSA
jgi:hypothetical protein